MDLRERKVIVLLGEPGMGKSRLAKVMLDRYRGGEIIILDPADQWPESEWPGSDKKALREWVRELTGDGKGPRNGGRGPGLVLLDDADRYLQAMSTEGWKDLWLANRHLQLDVIVTAHRPQGVPKDLIMAASELWLFAMEESNALDYLAKMPTLRPTFEAHRGAALPTKAGLALRLEKRSRSLQLVKVF